uniref:diacylglycerol kinase (ATP) n=1 Tax=Syphacia muris TaxID=451379 RepID=A0A0N5A8C9_9BILA
MEDPEVKAGHSSDNNLTSESSSSGLTNPVGEFHIWYVCSHGRPTHCNYCREKLSGMAWHGLSCEVCRMKAHKRCAAKIVECCKWKTEKSIPLKLKIADHNGSYYMPHQWVEGNLPLGCKCCVCDKTCGSVLKLQDWRCIWCGVYAHDQCKVNAPVICSLNQIRLSVLPPVAVRCIDGSGEAEIHWDCIGGELGGGSPLLVLVNSKSGENQGMRILAKFKRLLNPIQVIDIIAEGPDKGCAYFLKFDSFRVLVCGGDGTVGWVLTAVDSLELLSKCQIGILPLGTGNDLARVLGWGRAFDDESQLIHVIEKFERAHTRMLDRSAVVQQDRALKLCSAHYKHAIL